MLVTKVQMKNQQKMGQVLRTSMVTDTASQTYEVG